MKKILTAVLLAIPFVAFSQKIKYDKTDKMTFNGVEYDVRYIGCDKKTGTGLMDKYKFGCMINCMASEDSTTYSLSVYTYTPVESNVKKGDRVLIKLANDSIMTLYAQLNANSEYKVEYIGKTLSRYYETKIMYGINEDQLRALEWGIRKIKFETTLADEFSKTWKKDKIGLYLFEQYRLIKQTLERDKGKDKDNFMDNF